MYTPSQKLSMAAGKGIICKLQNYENIINEQAASPFFFNFFSLF